MQPRSKKQIFMGSWRTFANRGSATRRRESSRSNSLINSRNQHTSRPCYITEGDHVIEKDDNSDYICQGNGKIICAKTTLRCILKSLHTLEIASLSLSLDKGEVMIEENQTRM